MSSDRCAEAIMATPRRLTGRPFIFFSVFPGYRHPAGVRASATEQLVQVPAVPLGRSSGAPVSLRDDHDFLLRRWWGSEVVETFRGDDRADALDDETLHSHDALLAVAAHPDLIVGVHGLCRLDPF